MHKICCFAEKKHICWQMHIWRKADIHSSRDISVLTNRMINRRLMKPLVIGFLFLTKNKLRNGSLGWKRMRGAVNLVLFNLFNHS